MSTSIVNTGTTVTLKSAAALIAANPDCIFFLQGEPGIGKSSILQGIADSLGLEPVYIDTPNMDLGDIAMPVIDHATKTTKYYPNGRFKLHEGKPICAMIDEFPKGPQPVQNMLHPLFEVVNPRLGDVPLPKGSRVFLTGNLSTDGVGDNLKAHTIGRITVLTIRKPSADEWTDWAIAKGTVAPEVISWVKKFPQVMESYTDGNPDNPYIFNPKNPRASCVSPRSLERAGHLITNRMHYSNDDLIAALTGTIGEAGARALQSYVAFADQLPDWADIIDNPATATTPTNPGAISVLIYGAMQRVDDKSMTPWMKYLGRLPAEWQAAFCINIAKNAAKQKLAFKNSAFALWCAQNEDLL